MIFTWYAQTEIDFGDVTVSFFKTTLNSESMGIVLNTSAGSVVYAGDFKFDQTAAPGYRPTTPV